MSLPRGEGEEAFVDIEGSEDALIDQTVREMDDEALMVEDERDDSIADE